MNLLAGYGERIVTPPLGAELTGYGFYLDRRAESVLDDLKVRALVLASGKAKLAVLAFDLIGFTVEFADSLRSAVAETLGTRRENVLAACTHTHTGPATQPLPGLGEIDPGYMKMLPDAACAAAAAAAADMREASLSSAFEALEPIGFNRRARTFDGIDPYLKTARFSRGQNAILLLNYACHAVTWGRLPAVSADWPGAAVRSVEARGGKALVLQGFCGDIDPVTNLNRWGAGEAEDLVLYGEIVAGRAFKALARKAPADATHPSAAKRTEPSRLAAVERRIRVPLVVPEKGEIARMAATFLELNEGFPRAERFAREWQDTALSRRSEIAARPWIDNVPVQAMAVGDLRIIALPGEVFSSYSPALGKEYPGLLTVGYANGNIGYLPPREAFEGAGDYAAAFAPMFYTVFPFSRDIEDLLLDTAREVLTALD